MHFPRQPLLRETCIFLVVSFAKPPAMIYTFSLLAIFLRHSCKQEEKYLRHESVMLVQSLAAFSSYGEATQKQTPRPISQKNKMMACIF